MKDSILAIDPGTTHSAIVYFESGKIREHGFFPNELVSPLVRTYSGSLIACEMIASYGMPVGREMFETCVWIGRFLQNAIDAGCGFELVFRKDIKIHLCGSMRAKDANIRQSLIDKLGPQGTKKAHGPTYGVSKHAWAALAVAVFAHETLCNS